MKNTYEIQGDITIIHLPKIGGQTAYTMIDTADLSVASRFPNTWCALQAGPGLVYVAGKVQHNGTINCWSLHRVIMGNPLALHVDHINHDTLDNRRINLRVATNSGNQLNRSGANRNSKSGYLGVDWHRGAWRACFKHNRKTQHVGYFPSPEAAHEALTRARQVFLSTNQQRTR